MPAIFFRPHAASASKARPISSTPLKAFLPAAEAKSLMVRYGSSPAILSVADASPAALAAALCCFLAFLRASACRRSSSGGNPLATDSRKAEAPARGLTADPISEACSNSSSSETP